jgi:Family of unknown function (DUF6164)
MALRLMSLWNVPDDELEDIHGLLDANAIEYYETGGSLFAISPPALWLCDHSQLALARELLGHYAEQRSIESRQRWQDAHAAGTRRTAFDMLREKPLMFLLCTLLIAGLLYVSLVSVWHIYGGKPL